MVILMVWVSGTGKKKNGSASSLRRRSELLREGCRRYLYDMERWRQLRKIGARSAVHARVKSEQEVYALFRAERRTSSGKRRLKCFRGIRIMMPRGFLELI